MKKWVLLLILGSAWVRPQVVLADQYCGTGQTCPDGSPISDPVYNDCQWVEALHECRPQYAYHVTHTCEASGNSCTYPNSIYTCREEPIGTHECVIASQRIQHTDCCPGASEPEPTNPPSNPGEGSMYGTFLWDQNHDLATNDGSYFMQSPDYVCDASRYNLRGISLGYSGPENGSVAFNTRDNAAAACYSDNRGMYYVTNVQEGSYTLKPTPPEGWFTVDGTTSKAV